MDIERWSRQVADALKRVDEASMKRDQQLAERVETVLQRIRPLLQADGGDIELVGVDGNNARVRLTGMCAGCPSAHMTLYLGVEMALREEIREFEQLEVV